MADSRMALRCGGWRAACAALLLCAAIAPVAAQDTISIDFQGNAPQAMGAGEVAGVVPRSQWNNATGTTGTGLALVGDDGAATGATVGWSCSSTYQTGIADVAGNARMMRGYLDTTSSSVSTVNIAGVPAAFTHYDVYVYIDSDISGQTSNSRYHIAAAPSSTIDNITSGSTAMANFGGTFLKGNGTAGNYVIFRGLTARSFTLTATPVSGSVARAPINGLQIVALTPAAQPLPVSVR